MSSRLYQIIYAGEALDERGKALVDQLRFVQPVLTVESLGLNRAETNLFIPSPYDANLLPKESGVELRPGVAGADYQTSIALEAVPGCADWPTSQSMQTPIASTANGNGYSAAGPSYYNEAEHKYCNRTGGLNDYYALDFPLRTGDVVYAPFTGNVKWVGWTVVCDFRLNYKSRTINGCGSENEALSAALRKPRQGLRGLRHRIRLGGNLASSLW